MKKIYCISGLGADERAFCRLQIKGHTMSALPWLMPSRMKPLGNMQNG